MATPEQIARVAHAALRAWQIEHGDAHPSRCWEETSEHARRITLEGVRGFLAGDTPRDSHARWVANKQADGWTYGPCKDSDAKTHPCMVAYDDLMEHERVKDGIMYGIVQAMAPVLVPEPAQHD